MTSSERLPLGQRWIDEPVVYEIGSVPPIDRESFRLRVTGAVRTPIDLSWRELRAWPCVRLSRDLHCVTAWSVKDVVWEGVRAHDLVDRVSPDPEVRWAFVRGLDGYSTNVSIEHFGRPDSLLAFRTDDAPLSREHGYPLRLVVPSLYAWKSAKYVAEIEFLVQLRRGFWEEQGYHDCGDPWREERFRA